METLTFPTSILEALSLSERQNLLDICGALLGSDSFQLIIDGQVIQDRDELHDWTVSNMNLFR